MVEEVDFQRGEQIQSWADLLGYGASIRRLSAPWESAVELARETMRRARENVERLRVLLPQAGYEFADPSRVLVPPPASIEEELEALERVAGRLPLSVRCWYEQVGMVDLSGSQPEWRFDYMDPLIFEAPVEWVVSDHAERHGDEWTRGEPFTLDFSPDYLHKANVSGGAPYGLELPNEAVDGLVLHERHQTTFNNYLRICFRWAGLPGWTREAPDWARPAQAPPAALAEIAAELLPL